MLTRVLALTLITAVLGFVPTHQDVRAGGAVKKPDGFVHVEARGKLKTGIFAIGGETTGTVLNTGVLALELDFGKNQKLRDQARALDGKMVIATGNLTVRQGVTLKRQRLIVQVKTLKAAN